MLHICSKPFILAVGLLLYFSARLFMQHHSTKITTAYNKWSRGNRRIRQAIQNSWTEGQRARWFLAGQLWVVHYHGSQGAWHSSGERNQTIEKDPEIDLSEVQAYLQETSSAVRVENTLQSHYVNAPHWNNGWCFLGVCWKKSSWRSCNESDKSECSASLSVWLSFQVVI